MIEPDVPWTNVQAFFEAAKSMGIINRQVESSMNKKELVIRAITFKTPDRPPIYFRNDPDRSDIVQVPYYSPTNFIDPENTRDELGLYLEQCDRNRCWVRDQASFGRLGSLGDLLASRPAPAQPVNRN